MRPGAGGPTLEDYRQPPVVDPMDPFYGWLEAHRARMAGSGLTERQHEVLRAYVGYGSAKEAAYRLGITPDTLKGHVTAAYRAIGASGFREACQLLGWLRVT